MKKFFLLCVAVLAMTLTSCVNELKPTGDVNKDAESAGAKLIEMLKGIKSVDDVTALLPQLSEIQKKFVDFYGAKGDDQKASFLDAFAAFGKSHVSELTGAIADSKLGNLASGLLSAATTGGIIPTGDAAVDSKAVFDWVVDKTKSAKTVEDMENASKVLESAHSLFDQFYEAKGSDALAEFNKVADQYATEHAADLAAAQSEAAKNLGLDKVNAAMDALSGEQAGTALDELGKSMNQAADSIGKKVGEAVNEAATKAANKAADEVAKGLSKALGF